jgi:asparagine synthase (glutamine-hydrolysing)
MCGIAGYISLDNHTISEDLMLRMISLMTHRGPDGQGTWLNNEGTVGLGHLRLAILDLSPMGKQPMEYLDRYLITYNGEIYNYLELRQDLISKGYRFRSNSDTEVIMAAYDHYRETCLLHFEGMFSFALFDKQTQELFCARDRFGEKPFYFFKDGSRLVFASEIKAIFSAGVKKQIRESALYNYLRSGTLYHKDTLNDTFYDNIHVLQNAHYIMLNIATGSFVRRRYWDVNPGMPSSGLDVYTAQQRFDELFTASITRRLRSDVPVGSSLSGGLDSSSIVFMINRMITGQSVEQKVFSARFPGFSKDEGPFQDILLKGMNVKAYAVTPDENSLVDSLDKIFYHQEEPFNSASIYLQNEVYKLARQNNVIVLLDGQGADEFMGGYFYFYFYYFAELYKTNRKEYNRQYREFQQLHQSNSINQLFRPNPKFFLFVYSKYIYRQVRKLLGSKIISRNIFNPAFEQAHAKSIYYSTDDFRHLNDALYDSLMGGHLQLLLRYADKNSMSHSLEVRLPFLDHNLVEYMFSLSSTYKINNGWSKYLLRKTMGDAGVPADITWRKEKVGFEPPQNSWLQSARVRELISHSVKSLQKHGIIKAVDPNALDEQTAWKVIMSTKLLEQ